MTDDGGNLNFSGLAAGSNNSQSLPPFPTNSLGVSAGVLPEQKFLYSLASPANSDIDHIVDALGNDFDCSARIESIDLAANAGATVAATTASASVSNAVPPRAIPLDHRTDTAGSGVFANGFSVCPWCPGSSFSTAPAFMRHLTVTHEGCAVDDAMLKTLRALERAVCSNSACGCIRRVGTRHCHRCNETRSLRPVALDDIVPGARGVPLRQSPIDRPDVPMEQAARTETGDILLPADFSERAGKLPANTLVHIPVAIRVRMAKIATLCWEGMAAGFPGWCTLERFRSRLLLGAIPDGAHVPKEIATRVSLWEQRAFSALVDRIEMQQASRTGRTRKRQRARADMDCTGRRARILKQASEGAYRKAIDSLTTEVASFTSEENTRWATVLHPASTNRAAALVTDPSAAIHDRLADLVSDSDNADHDVSHPLRGVHFGALKGPGPSGTRPEHVSELLGVNRKRIASRALGALGKLMDKMEQGKLPEEGTMDHVLKDDFFEEEDWCGAASYQDGRVLAISGCQASCCKPCTQGPSNVIENETVGHFYARRRRITDTLAEHRCAGSPRWHH